jgi:beta-lactamase class A
MKRRKMDIEEVIKNMIKQCGYKVGYYYNDSNGNKMSCNENDLFETASCIKLYIMIEYFRQIRDGIITGDEVIEYTINDNITGLNSGIISALSYGLKLSLKDYVVLMIIISDNIATNKLIDFLGIDNINKTIKDIGLEKTRLLNRLDFSKFKKFGISTPYEYALTYEKILNGELFSRELCDKMLEILKKQKSNDMLTKGLNQLDILFKGTDQSNIKYIASKSGTIVWETDEVENVRNDGGIIFTNNGYYIIAIFISDFKDLSFNYNNEAINLGSEINGLLYKILNK